MDNSMRTMRNDYNTQIETLKARVASLEETLGSTKHENEALKFEYNNALCRGLMKLNMETMEIHHNSLKDSFR